MTLIGCLGYVDLSGVSLRSIVLLHGTRVSEASFLPEDGSEVNLHFFMVYPKVSTVFT